MHFYKNGYKRFLKTNSTDPRQRISLTVYSHSTHQNTYISEKSFILKKYHFQVTLKEM